MRAELLLVAALRGEPAPWPVDAEPALASAVVDAASSHDVAALVASAAAVNDWPQAVRSVLQDLRRLAAATEAVRRQDLIRLVEAFADAGVRCLLLKGAPLAYTHYSQPWLRPRFDTDLLIHPSDRARADAVLRELGYALTVQVSGTLVANQLQYQRRDRYQLTDTIDLHWKITNPHLFADALTVDELEAAAQPVPQLGPCARALSNVHALILACVHRVAHHQNSDRLIWLYDIHLLVSAMTPAEHVAFTALARRKRLRAICAAGLDHARRQFNTRCSVEGLDAGAIDSHDAPEPTAAFLQPNLRRVDILRSDLRNVGGWTQKLRLIREHVLPPPAYLRARYGRRTPLVVAYVDRVVTGMAKWFRAP